MDHMSILKDEMCRVGRIRSGRKIVVRTNGAYVQHLEKTSGRQSETTLLEPTLFELRMTLAAIMMEPIPIHLPSNLCSKKRFIYNKVGRKKQ